MKSTEPPALLVQRELPLMWDQLVVLHAQQDLLLPIGLLNPAANVPQGPMNPTESIVSLVQQEVLH